MKVGKQAVVMLGTSARGGIGSVIITYQQSRLFEQWPVVYIPTHSDGGSLRKLYVAVRALSRFAGLMLTCRILLVHVHGASNASFWRKLPFVMLARLARKPYIFHLHGGGFIHFYRQCGSIGRSLVKSVLDHAGQLIVLSEHWKARIAEITTNTAVTVIANPISDLRLLALPVERTCGVLNLLFLGAVLPRKGVFDLIKALAVVKEEFPQVTLTIAGEGEIEQVLKLAGDLGVRNLVKCHGWVDGQRKQDTFANAAVFVLPSYVENLPVAILEAMAAALPVVSTRIGGIPDLVEDGETGLLTEPGDVASIANAVLRLLKDAKLRTAMGAAARERALRQFSVDHALDEVAAVYARLGLRPRIAGSVK